MSQSSSIPPASSRLLHILKTICLTALCGILIRLLYLQHLRSRINKLFPGPPVNFFFGNIIDIIRKGGLSDKRWHKFLHDTYGKGLVRVWLSPSQLCLDGADTESCLEILDKCSGRSPEAYKILPFLGRDNLLFQRGDMVKKLRLKYGKMVSTPDALKSIHSITMETIMVESKNWWRGPVVPYTEFSWMIYDIMGNALFRKKWTENNLGIKIRTAHLFLSQNAMRWAFFRPSFHPDYREYVATIKRLRDICESAIDERRKEIETNPSLWANDNSVLTLLVTEKNEDGSPFFNNSLAVSSMIGFLNGAFDTTLATLEWCLYHVAKYPEVQNKLLKELDGSVGRALPPTHEDLRKLPYLHAFIHESIRAIPTVDTTARSNQDHDIALQGRFVPRNTTVIARIELAMQDPNTFINPEEFNPERFIGNSDDANRARQGFIGFGGYQRMCVGMNFALTEMKAIISYLLQRYSIQFENPAEPPTFTMRKQAGVNHPSPSFTLLFKLRETGPTL
jgi:cytochrome P450